jgi:subtilisin family serine protease
VDDDGNGYVDDVRGWDFSANDNDPRDENRHGTHVSGIIAAETNNGKGVAGVSWHARLMAVRFLDQNGSGTTEGGIDTILYAAKMGARIINASWGGGGNSKALTDAIDFAWKNGTLLVAAAGNDSRSTDLSPQYPSSVNLPGIIAVASSASDGALSSFSNFGQLSVDVVAPGSNVLSTLPGSEYGRLSGTSMATPMVSGVGALILSIAPGLSALELRNAILNAVTVRSGYSGKISTSGDLDAELAVTQFDSSILQVWPQRVTLGTGTDFQFTTRGGAGGVAWSLSDSKVAAISSSGVLTPKAAGTVIVTAMDSTGAVASTQSIQVIKASGGGGGCSARLGADPLSAEDAAGSALSLGLPIVGGFLVTRRRRKLP